MSSFDYFRLQGTVDELIKRQSSKSQQNKDWRLVNILPTNLEIWKQKNWDDKTTFVEKILGRETLIFPSHSFEEGDHLYVYFRTSSNTLIPFLEPYIVKGFLRDIKIGASVYRSTSGHLQVQASNWDMRGITLHNKIKVPLDVFYKGNLVAQLSANDGMSILGGSSSSLYFDNGREGLNFMDEISFSYSLPGLYDKEIFSIVLDDIHAQDVHLGVIQGGYNGPAPDTFAYSVNKPVWTGITYYVPTGRYNSRKTNPLAPF